MRVVVTGASGQLGAYLLERFVADGQHVAAWSGRSVGERAGVRLTPVDLADPASTNAALARDDPEWIVHAAAVASAEDVRREPERAHAVNVAATARLADWCHRQGRRLVFTSTDLVFDGSRPWNREDDPAEPVLAYGRTKRDAERKVIEAGGLVVRVSLLYGPSHSGTPTYLDRTLDALRHGQPQTFFVDEYRTPLDYRSAADALARLAGSGASGLIHVGGPERVSRCDLARRLASALGLDPGLVHANRQSEVTFSEPRPADVSLDSSRLVARLPGLKRPDIEEAASSAWEAVRA